MRHCTACGAGARDEDSFCGKCGSKLPILAVEPKAAELVAEPILDDEASDDAIARAAANRRFTFWFFGVIGVAMVVITLVAVSEQAKQRDERAAEVGPSGYILNASENASSAADNAMNAALSAADNAAVAAGDGAGTADGWDYSSSKDEMTDKVTSIARLDSTNSIYQGSPYGESDLTVNVRKHPRMGTDVYFTLASGQLLCPSYEGCSGLVRFDDGEPRHISLAGASDNSSNIVFVDASSDFIARLKRSRKMVMALEVYQAGRPNFMFDTTGFQWPPEAAKP